MLAQKYVPSGLRTLAREGSSNATGFECPIVRLCKQTEMVYFQTKTTQLVQNKTTFNWVPMKSLHFNVLYYSDICLVHYRLNLKQRG